MESNSQLHNWIVSFICIDHFLWFTRKLHRMCQNGCSQGKEGRKEKFAQHSLILVILKFFICLFENFQETRKKFNGIWKRQGKLRSIMHTVWPGGMSRTGFHFKWALPKRSKTGAKAWRCWIEENRCKQSLKSNQIQIIWRKTQRRKVAKRCAAIPALTQMTQCLALAPRIPLGIGPIGTNCCRVQTLEIPSMIFGHCTNMATSWKEHSWKMVKRSLMTETIWKWFWWAHKKMEENKKQTYKLYTTVLLKSFFSSELSTAQFYRGFPPAWLGGSHNCAKSVWSWLLRRCL